MVEALTAVRTAVKPWYVANSKVRNANYDDKGPAYPSDELKERALMRVRPEYFQAAFAMGFARGEAQSSWMNRHGIVGTIR